MHLFNAVNCRKEWGEFNDLLKSTSELNERIDVLPFFKNRYDLSILISFYFPLIMKSDRFAHEFEIYGDFVADLIIGDSANHRYLLVEFENGTPNSVFTHKKNKATPDWAPRFEGAYSQLIDWFWKLEDMRSTAAFLSIFGDRRASFHGLIVIGKDMTLSPQEKDRLKWRIDRTMIDSHAISCVSFDELNQDLDRWLKTYFSV